MITKDKDGKTLDTPIRATVPNNNTYTAAQREMFGTTLVEDSERLESFDKFLGFAEEYHHAGVLKYFGLSFTEWASLPVRRAKELLDLARFYGKTEYDMQVKAEKQTQNEVKRMNSIGK